MKYIELSFLSVQELLYITLISHQLFVSKHVGIKVFKLYLYLIEGLLHIQIN